MPVKNTRGWSISGVARALTVCAAVVVAACGETPGGPVKHRPELEDARWHKKSLEEVKREAWDLLTREKKAGGMILQEVSYECLDRYWRLMYIDPRNLQIGGGHLSVIIDDESGKAKVMLGR